MPRGFGDSAGIVSMLTRARMRRILRRTGWGVADQALSSLTNFGLGVVVAHAVSPTDFGAFSIAFAAYTIALQISRALCTEPLVVRYSAVEPERWDKGAAKATGTALACGVVLGLLAAACALAGGVLGRALLVLGLLLPGLLLQDAWRFAFFARSDGFRAFLNDLIWALVMAPGLALILVLDLDSVGWVMGVWGGAAALAAVAGIAQTGVRPAPGKAKVWLIEQKDLAPRYLGEFAALSGTNALVTFGVGAIAGLAAAGALRGADILLGPVAVLHLGINLVAVPEGVRALRVSAQRLMHVCVLISTSVGIAAVGMGVLLVLLPDEAGRALLSDTWDTAGPVIIPFALARAGSGVAQGAAAGLRALEAAQRSLRARLIGTPLSLSGGLGGALIGGARGAAIGLAIMGWVNAIVWWTEFHRGLSEHVFTTELDSSASLLCSDSGFSSLDSD
jgi:O-antigen/teichoic acid export membrane protein